MTDAETTRQVPFQFLQTFQERTQKMEDYRHVGPEDIPE